MVLLLGNCEFCVQKPPALAYVYFRGQNLQRIEVIQDDESEIVEAARRLSNRYDFVVTR